jgi:hypothetical protein
MSRQLGEKQKFDAYQSQVQLTFLSRHTRREFIAGLGSAGGLADCSARQQGGYGDDDD